MKKYHILIICLYCLLSTQIAAAQYQAPTAAQRRDFYHDMVTDQNDSWEHAGGGDMAGTGAPPKYVLWMKPHLIDHKHRYMSFSNEGGMITGEIYNTDELELATTSIKPNNASKYIYRVLEGDSIILQAWTTPTNFRSNRFTTYAYLGKFDSRNKTIRLEIAEKSNPLERAVYTYNSDNLTPVPIDAIFKQYENGSLTAVTEAEWKEGFTLDPVNKLAQINIKISPVPLHLEMYHVYLRGEFEGQAILRPIGNAWEHNFSAPGAEIHINSSYFSRPGKYTIILRPEMAVGTGQPIVVGNEVKAFFTVPEGPINLPVKTVAFIILIILTTGGFMFMMYRRNQQRKLARQAKDKQIATLQLASVRAQLNPHFIFNALAGIQNLMNKNDVENANKYLSRFARLTRNILDDGDKELTSIEHEISLLTDYLQMEQTRFGFNFSIDVDANEIDQQVEIPAMLLQPFAENAVKHGVSALKDKGMIRIGISKKGDSLYLTVKDNGKGFTTDAGTGMGMKLCKERIALLNSIYKNTTILLQQTSGGEGTVITIELRNWV